MTVKSEIDRLKQNVADSYNAIETNMGRPVADEHVSDYVNENISEIGRHLQAVVTDETVTMDVDLDDYEIIDLTNLDGNLQDKVITQNGEYTYDAGYTGLRNVTVDLDIDEKPTTITTSGTYRAIDDNMAGYTEVVVDYALNNEDITVTQNGTYTKSASSYDGLGTVTVALPLNSKTINHNGTYLASSDSLEGFTDVTVAVPLAPKSITRNGTYVATDDGVDGYSSVSLTYDTHNQDKTVYTNGPVTFDSGYDGLGTVNVALPLGTKTVTRDGTYLASSDSLEGFTQFTVDYDLRLEDISVNNNGVYTAGSGYDGLGEVTVSLDLDSKTITANGTYNASSDNLSGYDTVTVNVDVNNENRTFTANGTYYPTQGKNGIYEVTVNTPYQGYLDDINTALTNIGITPPQDYADLDTTITNSFGAILSELQDINGETSSNPLLDRITELEGYLNDIKTVLTNQGLTPPADYADLDTYINTAFNDIHNGLTDIHGES